MRGVGTLEGLCVEVFVSELANIEVGSIKIREHRECDTS